MSAFENILRNFHLNQMEDVHVKYEPVILFVDLMDSFAVSNASKFEHFVFYQENLSRRFLNKIPLKQQHISTLSCSSSLVLMILFFYKTLNGESESIILYLAFL